MGISNLPHTTRAYIVIAISASFLISEIAIGFRTGSLVLIADAFHCLNDLITFAVALVSARLMQRRSVPKCLPFGWQRAAVLGAFFNCVFLLALGLSISLQSIERFIMLEHVDEPKLVLIIGCVGVVVNLTMALIYHEHGHHQHVPTRSLIMSTAVLAKELESQQEPFEKVENSTAKSSTNHKIRHWLLGHDLASQAVVLHILTDAANDIGVIIASLFMMLCKSDKRFYADPAMSMIMSIGIMFSAVVLIKQSGRILLGCSAPGIDPSDVSSSLMGVEGVHSVHMLQIWQLNQEKIIASAHIVLVPNEEMTPADDSTSTLPTPKLPVKSITSVTIGSDEERVYINNDDAASMQVVTKNLTPQPDSTNEKLQKLTEAVQRALHPYCIYQLTLQVEELSRAQYKAVEDFNRSHVDPDTTASDGSS